MLTICFVLISADSLATWAFVTLLVSKLGVKIGIGSISAALSGPPFRPEKRLFCGGGGDGEGGEVERELIFPRSGW